MALLSIQSIFITLIHIEVSYSILYGNPLQKRNPDTVHSAVTAIQLRPDPLGTEPQYTVMFKYPFHRIYEHEDLLSATACFSYSLLYRYGNE